MDILSSTYTAFSAVDGHYEYVVMPQGARNAANHFARMVENAFGIYKNTTSTTHKMMFYQDDILNFSNNFMHHLEMQQMIFERMTEYSLIFKIAKSHINYKTQRVLGHILTKDGRLPDPSLIKTICELQKPTNLQQVQSLLGLAQVAREYIAGLATLIEPIQALSKRNIDL
jgi:hypothetical protein